MSGRQFFAVMLVLGLALGAGAAAAQEKNEIGGVVGRDLISTQAIQGATFFDPNIRFGKGLSFEGNYARRFLIHDVYSVSAEIPVMYNPDEDLHAGGPGLVPKDYSALFITPALRVNLFPNTAVSPWGSIGGGFGRFSENSTLLYGGSNTGKSKTGGVMQYGFGLDVRLWRRLHIRGEFRDFWSGEPDFPLAPTGKSRQHNYFVGAGAFWRF